MNKKKTERIAIIALAAFLVGYFCYQLAYGMTVNGNPVVFLANDTWTMVNSTSGSVGTITFHQINKQLDSDTWDAIDTFVRVLNGDHLTGNYNEGVGQDGCWNQGTVSCKLTLCYGSNNTFDTALPGCTTLTNKVLSQNHLEFLDQHGGTIHLIRQGMTMNNEMVVPSNGTVTFRGNGTSAQFSASPGSIVRNPSITGYTIGSNGTVTIHGPKGSWATFLGQPGSNTTTNVTPNQGYQSIENSTWYMINSTGSLSKIHFGIEDQNSGLTPYARLLNGNVHHGVTSFPGVTFKLYFGLCNIKGYECDYMKNIESYSDHLVFLDGHHNTIHLVR